jgi:hypothetical protein
MGVTWPTDEQLAILDAFSTGEDVAVEACAGSGKTSTLRMCSGSTRRRGLYVAFNRKIAQEAQETFPSSVECRTSHSLAYRAYGYRFKDRLEGPRQTGRDRARILGVKEGFEGPESKLSSFKVATLALDAVRRFCYSADEQVSYRHVPFVRGFDDVMDELREVVWPIARRAWDDVCSESGSLLYTHDFYLKRWALTEPRLGCDFVMLDEAQDANGLLAHLMASQDCQRVYVGDAQQSLYEWRQATDELSRADVQHRLSLTLSFRFGQEIADVANEWLDRLDASVRVRGSDVESSVGPVEKPDVILCRSNAGVVERAVEAQTDGHAVGIVGGSDPIKRMALAAIDLQAGKGTSHPDLFGFRVWRDVQEYCTQEREDAGEIATLVRIVDSYGARAVLEIAEAMVHEDYADVLLSTVHKFKGLEASTVTLHDDFLKREADEELRVAYVAVTRAKNRLDKRGLDASEEMARERSEKKLAKSST